MNFLTHTDSQQSLQRPTAPAGTGLGAKARVAQTLGENAKSAVVSVDLG